MSDEPKRDYLADLLHTATLDLADDALNVDILCAAVLAEQKRRERMESRTELQRLTDPDPADELPRRLWPSVAIREALVVYEAAIKAERNLDRAAASVGLPSGLDLCLEMSKMERVLRAREA